MSLISSSYYCYYYFSFIILTSQRHCRKYIYCMRADALNLPSNCFTPSVLPRTIDSRLGNILSVFFRFIWIIRRAVPILALMRNTFWVHPALYVAALGKKKPSKLLFWQSDLVRVKMQKTIVTLILFCAMKLSWPASGGQRHSVWRRLFSSSPFQMVLLYEKLSSGWEQWCAKCKEKNVFFFFFFLVLFPVGFVFPFFLVLQPTGVVFPSFLALQLVSEKFRSKAT